MDSTDQTLQVFVIADDPIEAGMLALDLVHAGLTAEAVRDVNTLLSQIGTLRTALAPVVISAFRDLSATLDLSGRLEELELPTRVVAVVLRAQRDAAERQSRAHHWAGVAVRPVNAEELVALARAQEALLQAAAGGEVQEGDLTQNPLLDVLSGLIDRIPRPGGGKNVVLELESYGRTGKVAVVEGELLHAEADGESGRHALERMACWRVGSWRLDPQAWTGAKTLTGSSIGLLAVAQEYNRRVEEARASLPYTDCSCTVRWERVRPLPVVAEDLFRRIAAGTILADALAGEGDDELEAYAALENRIKRGAVVPQIENAPVAAPGELSTAAAGSTPTGARPSTSFLSAGRPSAAAVSESPAPEGSDLPARPARPATQSYRVSDSGGEAPRHQSDMPPAFPVGGLAGSVPPALPDRPMSGQTSRMASGVMRTNNVAALDTNRYTSVENAARRGAITGWFGVAVADGDESPDGENAPLRSSSRPADFRSTGAYRSTPRPAGESTEAPKLSARPYAWAPDAPAFKTEDQSDLVELPKLGSSKPQPRWPWLVAGVGAVVAIVVTLALPGQGRKQPREVHGQDFRRANNLIEAGQYNDAIKRLQAAVQARNVEPDALLSLGVLEIEDKQFVSGRAHLDQYLALPDARHADRARKLYQHVFGASKPTAESATPAAPTPSAG